MQVTVEIPDAVVERAKARGKTPEEFVVGLVGGVISANSERDTKKLTIAEMLDRLAVNSDKIPQLPDEAFTRESFYQDHD